MGTEGWVQLVITICGLAAMGGGILARMGNLEKKFDKLETKVDRHNCFMERIARLEENTKSAHHRIDEIKQEL